MDSHVGSNAVKLVGEVFVPGASQLVSGNIGSGLVHNLIAGAAGMALIGTGVAPVVGTLAILAVKLNSYTSSVHGRSIWDLGKESVMARSETASARPGRAASTP